MDKICQEIYAAYPRKASCEGQIFSTNRAKTTTTEIDLTLS
jgi:hypothetical protein